MRKSLSRALLMTVLVGVLILASDVYFSTVKASTDVMASFVAIIVKKRLPQHSIEHKTVNIGSKKHRLWGENEREFD